MSNTNTKLIWCVMMDLISKWLTEITINIYVSYVLTIVAYGNIITTKYTAMI